MRSLLDFMPSLPKKVAIDIILVIAVLIFLVLPSVIFFWMGLHESFIEPVIVPPNTTDRPMNVEVQMPSEATRGEPIELDITLTNLGDKPVEGISMKVPSSNAIAGNGIEVGKLLPRLSGEYTLEVNVKMDAPLGESVGQLEVSSTDFATVENFTLNITT